MGSGAGGGTRADAGGQLLRELEALSHALYKASNDRRTHRISGGGGEIRRSLDDSAAMIRGQTWHSLGFDPVSAKPGGGAGGAANAVLKKKKKTGGGGGGGRLWDWRPLRALAHLGQTRLTCTFSAHIHAIKGLSPNLEGLRLQVRLRHKDTERRTVPSLVFRGAADIEEALKLRCNIYASAVPNGGGFRYMSKTFVLSIVAPDAGDLELGKHKLDLSRILPQEINVPGSRPSSWNTSFKLSGKAKGGILVITFGYEMEDLETGAGSRTVDHVHQSGFDGSASDLQMRSYSSLPSSPNIGIGAKTRHMSSPAQQSEPDFFADYSIEIEQLNLDDDDEDNNESDEQQGESHGSSSGILAPETPSRHEDDEMIHGEFSVEQEDQDGEFNVVEQGVEAVSGDFHGDNSSLRSWNDNTEKQVEDDEDEIHEFLDMLEDGDSPSHDGVDFSPRALLLQQYEQESAMVKGAFGLGNIPGQDAALDGPQWEDGQDLSAFVDAAESELQKATQLMKSKARAKMLEDAEAEALMQEWGLNEKAFQSSPPKSSDWAIPDPSSAMVVAQNIPFLAEGLGTMITTRDGGTLRSMNPIHFQGSRNEGRLVLHVSKPVVVPTDMGSGVLDIFRSLAAGGAENMALQVMDTMPLEDITGKTVHQIAMEGQDANNRYSLEAGKSKSTLGYDHTVGGPLVQRGGSTIGAPQSHRKAPRSSKGKYSTTPDDMYMSLDELAPVAMEKIEELAMQGLKIQSDMAEEEAPYAVDPLWKDNRGRKKMLIDGGGTVQYLEGPEVETSGGDNGLMSMSISLDEWMRLDAGVFDEAETDDKTMQILAAHNSAHTSDIVLMANNSNEEKDKQGKGGGLMGDTLTLAMLVQLRDPLRNYEPVGAPMMALVQAERVMVPPTKPKMWKRVSFQGNGEDDSSEDDKPQFKITGVHMAGLKPTESQQQQQQDGKKGIKLWGSQKQQQSGSRWLLAHGMAKTGNSGKHPLLKSRNNTSSATPSSLTGSTGLTSTATPVTGTAAAEPPPVKSNKLSESLWSISARLTGKSSSSSSTSSVTRNPDVKFGSRLSFGKNKKW